MLVKNKSKINNVSKKKIIKKNTLKHVVSVKEFTPKYINEVFALSKKIKNNPSKFAGYFFGKVFTTLFYEPSTRTRLSFESAINRLGGRVITVENARENSSAYKGESLEDTINTISNYTDCIIIRHQEDDSSLKAATVSSVPIVNAGAGKHEHPTQALLDAFTVYEKFGRLSNLNMTIVGDLFRGRTVYSLVYLLSKFKNNKFIFVSTENSKINPDLRKFLQENKIEFVESKNLQDGVKNADILYVTRIQRERCVDEKEYEEAKKGMIVNEQILEKLPEKAIIMHPLPRIDEITKEVDNDPRAWYFKQVGNGVAVRMAILVKLFE